MINSEQMFILSANNRQFIYKTIDSVYFPFRYIEIFRSTEQQMISSVLQASSSRNNFGGRNSNYSNFQSNGNNRMHPYNRNGGNNFGGGGNNMRGRNQNMRNDFRKGNFHAR